MSYTEEQYDEFTKHMEEKYPEMFSNPYGGFSVGAGWWPIIELLCQQIDSYTKWKNNTREALLKDNPYNHKIPDAVPQVVVAQIKEKLGGLRFYYDGGDDFIRGLETMAELWAGRTCEKCGKPGERYSGGWIRTLCEEHEAEHQLKIKERFPNEN